MSRIIGDQQHLSASAETLNGGGHHDFHVRGLARSQSCFRQSHGNSGIVNLQHVDHQRRLAFIRQHHRAFEFRLAIERTQIDACGHFGERCLRRVEFCRGEIGKQRDRNTQFVVFVHTVARKTRKIDTRLRESQAVQLVTFQRHHQFAHFTGAKYCGIGFCREIVGQVQQFGLILFLTGIKQEERHLRFLAFLHIIKLDVVGRETNIADFVGEVAIVVDHLLHHASRKAQAARHILGIRRDINRLIERTQRFRIKRNGEGGGRSGSNRLLVPRGHGASTVRVNARHQQGLCSGVADLKMSQGRHLPRDVSHLHFGSEITCFRLCGGSEHTCHRKEQREDIAKEHDVRI